MPTNKEISNAVERYLNSRLNYRRNEQDAIVRDVEVNGNSIRVEYSVGREIEVENRYGDVRTEYEQERRETSVKMSDIQNYLPSSRGTGSTSTSNT